VTWAMPSAEPPIWNQMRRTWMGMEMGPGGECSLWSGSGKGQELTESTGGISRGMVSPPQAKKGGWSWSNHPKNDEIPSHTSCPWLPHITRESKISPANLLQRKFADPCLRTLFLKCFLSKF
jgi:hypothetical protein